MKITIPTSLHEITVEQYQQFCAVQSLDTIDEYMKAAGMVSALCAIPLEDVIKIDKADFDDIVGKLTEMLNKPCDLVQQYNGIGFIPALDEITLGEYIDLEQYASDPRDFHKMVAVMYRPIDKSVFGKLYSIKEYSGTKERADECKKLPASLLVGGMLFFWNLGLELLKHIASSEQAGARESLEAALAKNGDGINPFTLWQMETISTLNALQK